MREQEPLLKEYFDLLINQLRRQIDGLAKGKVDLNKWMKLISYDISADLALGESFEALRNAEYHPWMQTYLASLRMLPLTRLGKDYAVVDVLLKAMSKHPRAARMINMVINMAQSKTAKRLDNPTERKDFIHYVGVALTLLCTNVTVLDPPLQ